MKKLINRVGIFLIGSALVSTLIPLSSAVSSPVKDAQKRPTEVTTQPIPAVKQSGTLISQNLDTSLQGKWTSLLTPSIDTCGVSLPSQIRLDFTVRISGNTVEIINGSGVYKGELSNNGRDAKALRRLPNGTLQTWLLWNRVGNSAAIAFVNQIYGCTWAYYGEAKFQGK